jgi:hypothetical protein
MMVSAHPDRPASLPDLLKIKKPTPLPGSAAPADLPNHCVSGFTWATPPFKAALFGYDVIYEALLLPAL